MVHNRNVYTSLEYIHNMYNIYNYASIYIFTEILKYIMYIVIV